MLQSYNRKEMDLDYRSSECVKSTPIFVDFMQRYDMAYGLELEHFLNVLEGKKKSPIDFWNDNSLFRKILNILKKKV